LSEFWRWVWLCWSVTQHRVNTVAEDKFRGELWELLVDCSTLGAWLKGCNFNHSEVRESWHTAAFWYLVISYSLSWCLGLSCRSSGSVILCHLASSSWCFERLWCNLGSSNQRRTFLRLRDIEGEVLGVLDAGNEASMMLWNIRKQSPSSTTSCARRLELQQHCCDSLGSCSSEPVT
jgi:hypothetical protein